ncbi:hypothetical protein [uncultured Imperialibacter sp.]|uniref:hypothetical protein n=1 Tax=uncultured Imperialibacter sp. TaxID=1672639 RepID=UPI0030DBA7E0|tara:strand:+ start:1065 stop:1286 length:222 start_codon:yes stop_codon:yes gene_type:complete
MATEEKLRKTILNKIKKLSDDKLPSLDAYLSDLESHLPTDKSPLSFSGIFKELELTELTSDLYKSREDHNTDP